MEIKMKIFEKVRNWWKGKAGRDFKQTAYKPQPPAVVQTERNSDFMRGINRGHYPG
jgi:hypothetical protein